MKTPSHDHVILRQGNYEEIWGMKKISSKIITTILLSVRPTYVTKRMRLMLLAFLIALIGKLEAQDIPRLEWVSQMGGASLNVGRDIFVDGLGNVYTTGFFWGTVDFDPGVGTFNLTSAGTSDVFVTKQDASGSLIWAARMGGTGNEDVFSITVDINGNVLTTGQFYNTVDFDPGPGVFNLSSAGFADVFISKLDASGNFIWAKRFGGGSNDDNGYSIAVDASGNVYTTGQYFGTVDFDPGVGVFNLTDGCRDVYVSKLSPAGDFIWAKRLGGPTCSDYGNSILVDASGNAYITGRFAGVADFDPNAGTFNLTTVGDWDVFICKLDATGSFVWAKQLGGTLREESSSMAMDGSGNLLITGEFAGTTDFDPGVGIFTLSAFGGNDVFVCKLNNSGDFVWVKQMGGTSDDLGNDITVDLLGNIYTTGSFIGIADFDPGSSAFNFDGGTSADGFVSKLDASGNFSWAIEIGGSAFDYGYGITVDALENVYTTGSFGSTNTDFDPTVCPFLLTTLGSEDIFVQKLSKATPLLPIHTITGFTPTVGPVGTTVTITGTNFSTIPANNTVTFFNNRTATVTASTATSITTTVPAGTITGKISVTTNCVTVLSATDFTIGVPVPVITSFAPISGPISTTVAITGTNFSATPANNIVYFGATRATVTAATATQLTVTVPVGATYQPITVNVGGLLAYSAMPFTVTFPGGGTINACSFAAKIDFTTGAFPRSVSIGDLDGDGKADLAVANSSSNTVSVFRNTGSGAGNISDATKVDFTTGASPRSVSIGDLDGDGKADLAVVNANSNTVSVFRNTGSAGNISYAPKVDFTTGGNPRSVSIGDLDGDGKADLAVTNYNFNTVSVFRNTSSGVGSISYAAKVDFATQPLPHSVAIGDLDGDGKADLAVDNTNSNVSVFRNTGSGAGSISFAAPVDFAAGQQTSSVSIGDLDGDGKADLVVANGGGANVSVFRNTSSVGSISYAAKVDFTADTAPSSVSIGDLDGDGKADLAVANSNTVSVFRNTGSGAGNISYAAKVDFAAGLSSISISIGDLDGDGKVDLAVGNFSSNTVSVFRNTIASISPPAIASFAPSSGSTGTSVTITGTNFDAIPANNIVRFNGTAAVVTASTVTSITTTVPGGATTGKISVTTNCITALSATDFTLATPQNFITRWNLATAGSGATQLSFGTATSGAVNYTWQEISPGSASGSGSWSGATLTITGLPASATIRLQIAPTNFQRIIINNGTNRNRLTQVESWGSVAWTSMNSAFYGCTNLQVTATDVPNLSTATNMSNMFRNCNNLNSPSNIGSWNTGAVTNMEEMFSAASAFNQNIGAWNTGAATSMQSMFSGASAFNQNIGTWNTAAVTNMQEMFYQASAFNQDISAWNTGAVTNMSTMFSEAAAFNQNIGSWNTAAVTDMKGMFTFATAFNQNIGAWTLKPGVDIRFMLSNMGMDCSNYSATLIGWSANPSTPNSRSLGATGRQYGTNAVAARTSLVSTKLWIITGDTPSGAVCSSVSLPTIANFTPTSGPYGTAVNISGTNFSTTPANNTVKFNGTTATVTASTAASITATVPTSATTGKITVTVASNTATSANDFTVTVPVGNPPVINTATTSTAIGGIASISLAPLLSDPDNNLDLNTLKIVLQPTSGALATIDASKNLKIDYTGNLFAGTDELTIEVCDLTANCVQKIVSIEVTGDIKIYNALSPNGQNPTFYILNINSLPETKNNSVTIFDRWQNEVWKGNNYDNNAVVFKGISNGGNDLPTGIYFYKIEFSSGKKMQTGFISLKR